MLSIGAVLANYQSHLPSNWKGLRSLFPPGYTGSISLLVYYVIFFYRQLSTQGFGENAQGQTFTGPSCWGHFWFGADGQGRWFFAWIYGDSDRRSDPRQGGFVFKFSPDSHGRGYVDTSRPPFSTLSCNAGNDPVISLNWPQVLSGGGRMSFQAPPADLNFSDVWTAEGFASFAALAGGHVPAEGVPSGSSLFPFPKTVPANALEPPAASLFSGTQDADGGADGGPSFFHFRSRKRSGQYLGSVKRGFDHHLKGSAASGTVTTRTSSGMSTETET